MQLSRQDLVANYCGSIKNASNEVSKKEIFVAFLTSLFGHCDHNGIIGQFTGGAEKGITNIVRKGKRSDYGRADTQYGNIIIEFENDLTRTGHHATMQLREYLVGNWNSGLQGCFSLIATDCLTWRIYTLDYESLFGLGELAAEQINLELVEEFTVSHEQPDRFYLFLDRYLFGTIPVPATLESIRQRFGAGSETFQSALAFMHRTYTKVESSSELEVVQTQWSKFLSIAYGHFEASEYIFLIHSYLSVLAKMLAYVVISGNSLLLDEEISQIIAGEIFKKYNIANFIEHDFFSWTATDDGDLRKAWRVMAEEIAQLDFSHITGDILKGVYQELVDDDTRHALGEHYTPDWLCARIVAEMKPQAGQKILDPACGSGSFLKAVANYLIEHKADISAAELNSALYGIDVHPLSVQITKATLLMAYGKRLEIEPQPITMNVFLANSLLLPEKDIKLMGDMYTIAIDETQIDIPDKLFANQEFFAKLVKVAESYAENDYQHNKERDEAQLHRIFCQSLALDSDDQMTLRVAIDIYHALFKAMKGHRNGIWSYILANTYAPVSLKNQFDIVLGNPPWITFRDIVANDYQNALRVIAKKTGCQPARNNLIANLELASLFVGWSLSYFLQDKGKMAFVMPRSIFMADQHHRMREGKINYLKINRLWDLKNVNPLFNIPACVLFCEKISCGGVTIERILGKTFSGNLSCHDATLEQAMDSINEKNVDFFISHLNEYTAWSNVSVFFNTDPAYKNKFFQGATLIPHSLCFVEIDQIFAGSMVDRQVRIRTSAVISSKAKEPWKNIVITGTVFTRYMFVTCLANNIVPFGINGSHLVALPIIADNASGLTLVTSDELENNGELETAKWFKSASDHWDIYKTERNKNISFYDYLNWQNKILKQNLACRYLTVYTRSAANAVSTVIDRLHFELPYIAEQSVIYYTTDDKEEAMYLCAYLNSNIPNRIIKSFQSHGLFGPRDITKKILELPIPKYNPKSILHQDLGRLAQVASDKVVKFVASQNFDRYGNNMNARECGRFRNKVRTHIQEEIKEIDDMVTRLIKQ